MRVNIDNCIGTNKIDEAHKLITGCCCQISCNLINENDFKIDVENLFFSSTDFVVSNILIDNNPLSLPFILEAFQSVTFDYTICAPSTEVIENVTLSILTTINGTNPITDVFSYYFESLAPLSFISPTSLNFGNIAVGNGSSLYINVPDTLICCNDFYVSTLTAPFLDNGSITVCPGDGAQQIGVFFTPTIIGLATQDLIITINECNSIVIPLSGNGIEPPSGGSSPPQKNKVDQTTRVEACSPRTVNNRCNTARTLQSAIKTNAKRFGKR